MNKATQYSYESENVGHYKKKTEGGMTDEIFSTITHKIHHDNSCTLDCFRIRF